MSELETFLTGVADAIREKKGTTAPIPAQSFASEIRTIEGGSKVTDIPLTLTENGTTEAPEGVRYTPITVEVPKPTLNAPKIEFNANGGYMYILDGTNGNFSEGYQLYLNGEENVVLTSTNIKMQDYGIFETDEVGIVAVGNLFNNSPMATARWSDLELGTIGLSYSGNACTGLGTATDTDIYVASIVNGIVITQFGSGRKLDGVANKTIHLPNSITTIGQTCFGSQGNFKVICGRGLRSLSNYSFAQATDYVLDLRNVEQIPVVNAEAFQGLDTRYAKLVVRDEVYDAYIVATGWAGVARFIVKASIYEAQQGGAV